MTADLLDEIRLAQQVDAERRRGDVPSIGGRGHIEAETLQDALDFGVRDRRAQQAREAIAAQMQAHRPARTRVAVDGRPDARPAPICSISAIARSMATTCALMSAPRSKRVDASVLRPRRLLVRRTEAGLKYALSSAIVVVVSETSEAAPPMTPAIACARS